MSGVSPTAFIATEQSWNLPHMKLIHSALAAVTLMTAPILPAADVPDFKAPSAQAEGGDAAAQAALAFRYLDGKGVAKENLYILCNPAVATPGLQLITADDLKNFWRSDHYGELSKGVLSRPAFVINHP